MFEVIFFVGECPFLGVMGFLGFRTGGRPVLGAGELPVLGVMGSLGFGVEDFGEIFALVGIPGTLRRGGSSGRTLTGESPKIGGVIPPCNAALGGGRGGGVMVLWGRARACLCI